MSDLGLVLQLYKSAYSYNSVDTCCDSVFLCLGQNLKMAGKAGMSYTDS